MRHLLHRFSGDQSGVTAIEYGLIAALIALVIIVALTTTGNLLTDPFAAIDAALT